MWWRGPSPTRTRSATTAGWAAGRAAAYLRSLQSGCTAATAQRGAIAFDRSDAVTIGTRLPLHLERSGGWHDTFVQLASRPVVDAITGAAYDGVGVPACFRDATAAVEALVR